MVISSGKPPGQVRDAVIKALREAVTPLTVKEISQRVEDEIGETPTSSIRFYLRLNAQGVLVRESRGVYRLRAESPGPRQKRDEPLAESEPSLCYQKTMLHHDDCFSWIERQSKNSIHAVVTDPPYGLLNIPRSNRASCGRERGRLENPTVL